MGLSGADLEYQRMLREAGRDPSNPNSYKGADAGILEQESDMGGFVTNSQKGVPNGFAGLGVDAKLVEGQVQDRLSATVLEVTNANLAVKNGWYWIAGGGVNSPSALQWGYIRVVAYSNTRIYQEWIAWEDTTEKWERRFTGAGWGAWLRVHTGEADLDARYKNVGELVSEAELPSRLKSDANWPPSNNLNLATSNGWYAAEPTTLNIPNSSFWMVAVDNYSEVPGDSWIVQTATEITGSASDTKTYQRKMNGGSGWGAWFRVRQSETELDALYKGDNGLPLRLATGVAGNLTPSGATGADGISVTGYYSWPSAGVVFGLNSSWGMALHVIAYDANNVRQVAFSYDVERSWTRQKTSGVWSAWRDVPSSIASRSQDVLSCGGTLTVTSTGGVTIPASSGFIVISKGRGYEGGIDGYFTITRPPDGTVISGSNGASNKTVTGGVIPLNAWDALYYRLPLGGLAGSDPSRFVIYSYTAGSAPVSDDMVFIALNNADTGFVKFGNGVTLPYGSSWSISSNGDSGWHLVGGGGEPAFQNSWVNYGGTYAPASFRKTGSLVRLRGLIKLGVLNTPAFTLPVGYRPTHDRLLVGMSNAGATPAACYVYTDGRVVPYNGTNGDWSLDSISFTVD